MPKHSVELTSFEIPAGVYVKRPPGRREDGFKPPVELKLHELDVETLEELCAEFRRGVFEQANKPIPSEGEIAPHRHYGKLNTMTIPREVTDAFDIPVYLIIGRDTKTGETWSAPLNGQERWHHKDRVVEAVERLKQKQTNPHVIYEIVKESR